MLVIGMCKSTHRLAKCFQVLLSHDALLWDCSVLVIV